ncbi:hypothetical protein [Pseudomonas amygdali]|uniref:Uncharacterized protein n=2 Tax=Pseudomonas amygdali pv. lachrymans TaxID=53707 RepID=A0AAD0V9I7_PSEAV|nr:hypothetical protein [Pseudomonas amygdali]AXH59769.1 hypothetical protein PLA107_031595 [Pseudomonas amygdali pv. lachrymans str. M301315]
MCQYIDKVGASDVGLDIGSTGFLSSPGIKRASGLATILAMIAMVVMVGLAFTGFMAVKEHQDQKQDKFGAEAYRHSNVQSAGF